MKGCYAIRDSVSLVSNQPLRTVACPTYHGRSSQSHATNTPCALTTTSTGALMHIHSINHCHRSNKHDWVRITFGSLLCELPCCSMTNDAHQFLNAHQTAGRASSRDFTRGKFNAQCVTQLKKFEWTGQMSFASGLLELVTITVGGSLFVALCVCSVFCGLSALLALSQENPHTFKTIQKVVGGVMLVFGFLLLFRDISIAAFILSVWWEVILFEVFPAQRVVQWACAMVLSLVFWGQHTLRTEETFLLKIGDFTIFLIVPFVVVLVQLSRNVDTLTGQSGQVIPLQRVLGMLSEILAQCFPDYRLKGQ